MKALIMFAHPNPESFNGLILSTVEKSLTEKGYEYVTRNLYDSNFNPIFTLNDLVRIHNQTRVEDIAIEQLDIMDADVIIFIYPVWWSGPPAILKGWFDRVFTKGFAYGEKKGGGVEGLLDKKKVMVFTTAGATIENDEQEEVFKAMETILLKGIFKFCGITDIVYETFYGVIDSTNEERNSMIDKVKNHISNL